MDCDFVFLDLPALDENFSDSVKWQKDKYGDIYFSRTITPFNNLIEECLKYNKLLISPKPDFRRFMTINGMDKVVSIKAIVDEYVSKGRRAIEIGKPYIEAYEYIFKYIECKYKVKIKDKKNIMCWRYYGNGYSWNYKC